MPPPQKRAIIQQHYWRKCSDRPRWTLGGGLEWAFWDRWSAKAEYLYIDFGNGPTVALTPAFTLTTNHLTDNIGRVGVNYRF